MTTDITGRDNAGELRKRAEKIAANSTVLDLKELSPEETRQLIHELRVHQIELEMQNEELRRTQMELEASRARYFDLYDLAPVGYLTTCEKGLIQEANLTFAGFLGVTRSALVKQSLTHFIFEDQDVYYHHRRRLFETGEPQICELRLRGKDSAPFWVRLEATVTQDVENGAPMCRVAISDINAGKLVEAEKEKLQAQLDHARKMESVGTLARGLAHEFNNILQTILGYTSLILLDKNEVDQEYPHLRAIENAATRAAKLVKQLLLFSRKLDAERRPVDLNLEVEHARKLLSPIISKNIDLEIHPGPCLRIVKADPVQIEQALLNLGNNAIDAMPQSGKIIIKTENITLDEGHARQYTDLASGDYVLLTFSDTGWGLSKETMEKIFDPFFTTKEIGKGTG
ncbi:MAG: PAS domain-containing protein, partial [Deltaproteobacteria bacterium]|nr:PAS domain-containing protein [Deltaproteobacteria bacterium]